MSKRQTGWTETKIAKYYKEGRGRGEFSSYQPWLTVQNVPSQGRSHRPKGWKTNRVHQLFSDLEFNYFCLLEWANEVVDIREQYPLNREVTISLAEKKGIKHPMDSRTQTPIVMTTDFFITIRKNNEIKYLARTLKYADELNKERVMDKFEIERAYWEENGVSWGIVTEKEIHNETINNIKWLHKSYFDYDNKDQEIIRLLLSALQGDEKVILKVLTEFDVAYNLEEGTALSLFKWMLVNKIIKTNIRNKIDLKNDTSTLLISEIDLWEKRWAT